LGTKLIVLIDQISLDGRLWPGVLKLADAIGAAHVSITSRDRSANTFASITPRADPDFVASIGNIGRSIIRSREPRSGLMA
jgi:hypothetical protein